MNQLQLFLPCAAGVEDYLAPEALRICGPRTEAKPRDGDRLVDVRDGLV